MRLVGVEIREVGAEIYAALFQIFGQCVFEYSGSRSVYVWARSVLSCLLHKYIRKIQGPIIPLNHALSIHGAPYYWNIREACLTVKYTYTIL